MTALTSLIVALPGLPDVRRCSAGECEWLIAFMAAFLAVLLGLLGLAIFFHVRDWFTRESDPMWRKVS